MSDDKMAKARAAKAAKAAAKTPEPEMEIVERTVTETTHKTTPTGQEKTKTVETVYRPKAATSKPTAAETVVAVDPAEPRFTEAEQAAIDRAGQKTRGGLSAGTVLFFALLLAMLAGVAFLVTRAAIEAAPEPTPTEAPVVEAAPPPAVRAPEPEPAPAPKPRSAPKPKPTSPVLESASPPPPSPERNMTAYIMRPFGDRRDDFIVYDFDFRRVCVTNSSDRAELPQTGCMAYESLSATWKTTYDQLCRRYYAFAEVCPADVTADVVIRELQYHEND